MHALNHRPHDSRLPRAGSKPEYRTPHYDCADLPAALKLILYVPGVDANRVDLVSRGPDLIVTARKTPHIRANWQALHLENVQRDYQLKLRLGFGFDFEALHAFINRGVLTIVLPKSRLATAGPPAQQRRWPSCRQSLRARRERSGARASFSIFLEQSGPCGVHRSDRL